MGHAEEGIKVAFSAKPVVGFVDSVEKIGEDDGYVDTAAMFDIKGRTGLGFGVASTNHDTVVETL